MAQAKQGDSVKVHYTGKLGDGSIFDTSANRAPLEFIIGEQQVIPGFEQAVVGMDTGEQRTAVIPAAQAYGTRDEGLVIEMDKSRLAKDLDLEVDDRLQVRRTDGQIVDVTVTAITDAGVTLDGNHFLAGQDLTFDIELVEIA